MSEEYRKKLAEARNMADRDGGFAAAVNHLFGPNIRRTK